MECWNKGTFKDEPMGGVSLSVVRFMKQPFTSYTERLPIYYQGSKTSQSKLVVEIVFEEARAGMFELTLYEARGLRNVDPMGSQRPYVKFKLGRNYAKRSKTVKDSGTAPYFGEEKVLIWADRESWVDDLQVMLLDEGAFPPPPLYDHTIILHLNPHNSTHPRDSPPPHTQTWARTSPSERRTSPSWPT